ncbi:MAG: hypothetical protein R3Y47_04265 [Lachnospiraceae bacterium]
MNLWMKRKKKFTQVDLIHMIFISACTIFLLVFAFDDAVWGDEAFTMIILRMNWIELIQTAAADVHPPLYYIIAKLITMIFGLNVTVLKTISIIPVTLTMILGATLVKDLFGGDNGYKKYIPLFFISTIALAPGLFYYALELRMYTWSLFFVTYVGLLAYDLFLNTVSTKRVVLLSILGLCAAYTHYFSLISVAIIYSYLFIALLWKNKMNYKICIQISIISIIGYLPWVGVFYKQCKTVHANYWIPEFSLWDVLVWLTEPFRGTLTDLFLGIFILTLVLAFYNFCFKKYEKQIQIVSILYVSLYFVTVLVGMILSILIRPIFQAKYAFSTLGLLWLGVIVLIQYIKPKKCIIASILLCMILEYAYPVVLEWNTIQKDGEELMLSYIHEHVSTNTYIVSDIGQCYWLLPAYLPEYTILSVDEISDYNIASIEVLKAELLQQEERLVYITRNPYLASSDLDLLNLNDYKSELSQEFDSSIGLLYIYNLYH